jgi:two-component system, chemotaxis family, response regulator Rcp1
MSRPIRILIVEDNPGDVDLIKDTLQGGTTRLDITVVGDGAEAVDYLFHLHQYSDDVSPTPDFVLLDLNLPKMSGHDVLKEARRSSSLRSLPIIVMTSSDSEPDIVRSYALGANCYVTKPGELDAFQSTMKAVGDFWCRVAKLP